MTNLRRVLSYFRPDRWQISLALVLLILSAGLNILKPWPLAWIVDSVLGNKPLPNPLRFFHDHTTPGGLLILLALALFLVHASHGALSAWQNFLTIKIGLRGLVRVRQQLFAWLHRLSLRFHQSSTQGDLLYRASWDTYAFQTIFQQGVFASLTATISLLLMLVVMWQLNGRLTLVSLAAVPPMLLAMRYFAAEMKQRSLNAHQADSRVTSVIQQNILALPLIQSYTREETEQKSFRQTAHIAFDRRVSQHGWEVVYWLAMAFIFGAGIAAVTWMGARQVQAGALTVGELLVFIAYLTQLYEPLNQLSHAGSTVSDASAGTQRVFELLDTPEEIQEPLNARPVLRPKTARLETPSTQANPLIALGAVTLNNVSFGYEKHRPVLKNVHLTLQPGQSTALIGPSGAGKTTLLQLLPRFYDPDSGQVLLDGADIRTLNLKDLRAQIALVPQEPILLPASVSENIAYGKPGASPDEIRAAARAAHAEEFICRLPNAFETPIGEGGARLSVGEKQRINLARAFLKDAPILVLDEPTSALDLESEMLVVESLAKLMHGRTSIIVAHRLSTIQQATHIAVLKDGALTEIGTAKELLQKPDGYLARVAGQRLRLDQTEA